MKEKTVGFIAVVYLILLFLFVLIVPSSAPDGRFFTTHSTPWIMFLRFFSFPLLFSGYILFQKLIKKRNWQSLSTDLLNGSLFTLFSAAILAFLFI